MSEENPIQFSNVSYFFGKGKLRKQVLFEVSETIRAGEIVILTGPSGSGKTTLLTLIGALRSAQSGNIRVMGNELNNASVKQLISARREIGYIFQTHNLLDFLSVRENVNMSLNLSHHRKQSRKRREERVRTVLSNVGLEEHIEKLPRQLSSGQKQRVGVARALVNSPRIILADEPTASLDKKSGRDVVDLIQKLAREGGASVVMVTHDNRILDVADRILHLEDGRLKTLSAAVASNATRLFNLLETYDKNASQYINAFSMGLARVAFADNKLTQDEIDVMLSTLIRVGRLEESEARLVLELATRQAGLRTMASRSSGFVFTEQQRNDFIDSLKLIANADGNVTPQEIAEIQAIATDYGFPVDRTDTGNPI